MVFTRKEGKGLWHTSNAAAITVLVTRPTSLRAGMVYYYVDWTHVKSMPNVQGVHRDDREARVEKQIDVYTDYNGHECCAVPCGSSKEVEWRDTLDFAAGKVTQSNSEMFLKFDWVRVPEETKHDSASGTGPRIWMTQPDKDGFRQELDDYHLNVNGEYYERWLAGAMQELNRVFVTPGARSEGQPPQYCGLEASDHKIVHLVDNAKSHVRVKLKRPSKGSAWWVLHEYCRRMGCAREKYAYLKPLKLKPATESNAPRTRELWQTYQLFAQHHTLPWEHDGGDPANPGHVPASMQNWSYAAALECVVDEIAEKNTTREAVSIARRYNQILLYTPAYHAEVRPLLHSLPPLARVHLNNIINIIITFAN